MAITLAITGGTMKIAGFKSEDVFISANNGIFTKNLDDEYILFDSLFNRLIPIGAGANVNGGITDAALEGLLTGFFSNRLKTVNYTAIQASALTAEDGYLIYVTSTDATFTSVGFWGYENGVWVKL